MKYNLKKAMKCSKCYKLGRVELAQELLNIIKNIDNENIPGLILIQLLVKKMGVELKK